MAPWEIARQSQAQVRSLARLLVGLRGHELTGLVQVLERSGRSSSLYLRRGRPVHVVRPDHLDRLDQVLLEAGWITDVDLARAQTLRESTGMLFGQVIKQLGLLEDNQLVSALQWQLRRKVTRLFSSAEDASFEVSPMDHPFGQDAKSPGMAIEPRTLVFPGIVSTYPSERLAAELAELSGKLVRLRSIRGAQLAELGFQAPHGPLLAHLHNNGHRIDARWLHEPGAFETKAVLLALHYLDLLDFPEHQPRQVPVASRSLSDSGGVPISPNLSDSSSLRNELDLEQVIALAERFFRNGDLRQSEAAFEEAAAMAPKNSRVRAFLIWIHFWKEPEFRRLTVLDLTISAMRETLSADRDFAFGHYFIGGLFKLRKDLKKAEAAFRNAVRCDPGLLDAQRELRLLTLRRSAA